MSSLFASYHALQLAVSLQLARPVVRRYNHEGGSKRFGKIHTFLLFAVDDAWNP